MTAVAVAGGAMSVPTFVPKMADQVTNLDILRSQIKNYYGTPTAVAGAACNKDLAPAADGNYAAEAASVAADGGRWLSTGDRATSNAMKAIVLDVDDTTLATWNYELCSNWAFDPVTNGQFVTDQRFPAVPGMVAMVTQAADDGYAIFYLTGRGQAQEAATLGNLTHDGIGVDAGYPNPTTNAQFVGITNGAFTGNMFPPTPGMLGLANHASSLGYSIFWITGRGDSQHAATIANLVDDSAAGLPPIDEVTLNGHTIPEVDAGYPLPTPIDIGHGGFTDGLFTKPPVGSYPAYLDTPQFCGPFIDAGVSCPTIQYKSGTRAYIESQGYDIVADIGDQFSDLEGNYADKVFKMPNPNYYLP